MLSAQVLPGNSFIADAYSCFANMCVVVWYIHACKPIHSGIIRNALCTVCQQYIASIVFETIYLVATVSLHMFSNVGIVDNQFGKINTGYKALKYF